MHKYKYRLNHGCTIYNLSPPNSQEIESCLFSFKIEAENFWTRRNFRNYFNQTVKSSPTSFFFFFMEEESKPPDFVPCSRSHGIQQSQTLNQLGPVLIKKSSLFSWSLKQHQNSTCSPSLIRRLLSVQVWFSKSFSPRPAFLSVISGPALDFLVLCIACLFC